MSLELGRGTNCKSKQRQIRCSIVSIFVISDNYTSQIHGLYCSVSIHTSCDVGLGIGLGAEAPREKTLPCLKHEVTLESREKCLMYMGKKKVWEKAGKDK